MSQEVWNIWCGLCQQPVKKTEWMKDASGANYHKDCYEAAIREMTRFIIKNAPVLPKPNLEDSDLDEEWENHRR